MGVVATIDGYDSEIMLRGKTKCGPERSYVQSVIQCTSTY